jgi:hypothetical protein
MKINEDWLATVIGLALLVLAMIVPAALSWIVF